MKIKTTLILLFLGMFLVSFVSADTQQLTMSFFIPINQTDSVVYTYLNNSQANAIVTAGNSIDLNVSLITGDLTSELQLFNNGTLINQGISPLYNSTTFSNVGDLNITGCYVESQNYSRSCEQFNVTVLAVPDTTYPIFSNEVLVPINNSEYTPSTNSVFNITLENTNGTVWLNFDGTDYYATNVSNLFEVDVGQLSVGSYEYNWSSYGNGTDSLFNSTLTSSYTIQINSTLTLELLEQHL